MCLRPLEMYPLGLTAQGKKILLPLSRAYEKLGRMLDTSKIIPVPCGKCDGCRFDKVRDWISRLILENKCHSEATFITLTYNEDHLPLSPDKRQLQLMLKRMRNVDRDFGVPIKPFRYFLVSERGDCYGRLHYHGLIFGVDMLHNPLWRSRHVGWHNGYPTYTSDLLSRLWPYGFNTVDSVNDFCIRYVASYILDPSNFDSIRLFSKGLGRGFFLDDTFTPSDLNPFARSIFSRGNFSTGDMARKYCRNIPRSMFRYLEKYDLPLFNDLIASRRNVAAEMCRGRPSDYVAHYKLKLKEIKERKTL